MKFSRHVNFANFAFLKNSRNLSDAKIKCRKNNMTRKLSDSLYVVMFWSSLSLLFSVSTPGSTSFVQSSNCPFIWTLLIKFDQINNIDKETVCLNPKREITVSQNAKFSQNREIKVSRNIRTSKSRN